jgi:hypothetical protein
MLKKSFFGLSIILIAVFSVFAQSVYTPEKGSAERTSILNALPAPVERELKQKIQFAVTNFKVQENWAFLDGEPQNASGSKPKYENTAYGEAIEAGMFDNNFFALLRKSGGKWRVVKYQIGCTDVCYLEWREQYRAPKAIFPFVPE